MHGQHPDHYRYQPRGHRDTDLVERVEELERRVKSLYSMLERRDKKIARLERKHDTPD